MSSTILWLKDYRYRALGSAQVLYKHVWGGGTKYLLKDLNSYPTENGFLVCDMSLKTVVTAHTWENKSHVSMNHMKYQSKALN